jgi:hypothetical protein
MIEARGSSELGMYLLASSLTAALLDGLFEHPVVIVPSVPYARLRRHFMDTPSFSAAC